MSQPENNSFAKSAMPPLMDLSKLMSGLKAPSFDVEALMEINHKNIEAVTTINQFVFDSLQSFARHQADFIRQSLEEQSNWMNSLMSPAPIQGKVLQQTEMSKVAVEKCLTNARDAADALVKCNNKAMETISNRMQNGLTEFKSLIHTNMAA